MVIFSLITIYHISEKVKMQIRIITEQIIKNIGLNLIPKSIKLDQKPLNSYIFRRLNMKETKILIAEYIASLKTKTGITNNGDIAEISNTAEGTVKNLCSAKTDNPGIVTVAQIIYSMGGSLDEIFNKGKIKDEMNEVSFLAIKEIYAEQFASAKATHAEEIANIRQHYEQHHQDLVDNFEKRLADKREIIEMQKKEHKLSKMVAWVLGGILIALLIIEVMNPTLGWIRY